MPRYFFNFRDGANRLDDREGVTLPDPEAAWYQGVRTAREIIDRDRSAGSAHVDRHLEIVDEHGWQIWSGPLEDVMGFA